MEKFIDPLLEQLDSMWIGFVQALPMLGIAIVVLFITSYIAKFVAMVAKRTSDKTSIRPSLQILLIRFSKLGVWIVGVLVAGAVIFPTLTPDKILGALGLGTLAIGFAFQDIFENFMAGIMIMLRKEMRIGDYVEVEGEIEGMVEQINMRDTFIRQTDGQLVMVPNAILFKNPLIVRTQRATRRFEITMGVGYDTDLDVAKKLMIDALKEIDVINEKREPEVFAKEFNSSSIDFTVRWWADPKPRDMHVSRDEVVRALKRTLDKAGIEIPFPQSVVTFANGLQIDKAEAESDDGTKKKPAAKPKTKKK